MTLNHSKGLFVRKSNNSEICMPADLKKQNVLNAYQNLCFDCIYRVVLATWKKMCCPEKKMSTCGKGYQFFFFFRNNWLMIKY